MHFSLHALTATIGIWIALTPFVIERFLMRASEFFSYQAFILGLILFLVSLFLAISEQGHAGSKTLHSMHFVQGFCAITLALTPFLITLKSTELAILSIATGGIIAILALLQLSFE